MACENSAYRRYTEFKTSEVGMYESAYHKHNKQNNKSRKHARAWFTSRKRTSDRLTVMRERDRSSRKGRRTDALALRADERRDKLRKAVGRSKYPVIHGCLNGETRLAKSQSPCTEHIGVRREPGELKHLSSRRKRKQQ